MRDALLGLHELEGGREALQDLLGAERLVPVRRDVAAMIAASARR